MVNVLRTLEDAYLGAWSIVGSILGFLSFANKPGMTWKQRLYRCFLSVGIGLLIAFPVFTYLLEYHNMSTRLSMMIAGLCAFGLPDFILRHWPSFLNALSKRFLNKVDKEE